ASLPRSYGRRRAAREKRSEEDEPIRPVLAWRHVVGAAGHGRWHRHCRCCWGWCGIDMTKLVVAGKEIDVSPDYTLLQACEAAGAEIPRFCFHERLSIAGNCRMCLVELKGSPKPVASCAWGVRDCRPGPKGEPPEVLTKTPMVRKAREGV